MVVLNVIFCRIVTSPLQITWTVGPNCCQVDMNPGACQSAKLLLRYITRALAFVLCVNILCALLLYVSIYVCGFFSMGLNYSLWAPEYIITVIILYMYIRPGSLAI